jgi:hypothetical protein
VSYLTDEELQKFRESENGQDKCARCRFWFPYEPPSWGEMSTTFVHFEGGCHRHSPVIVEVEGCEEDTSLWPKTDWNDWCGDFDCQQDNFFDVDGAE